MLGYFRQNLAEYLKSNIVAYFFIILIFIVGIVVGALAVKTLPDEQKTELISYLRIFFTGLVKGADGIGDTSGLLGSAVLNNIKTVSLMWVLGFTIVGIPFVLFMIFTRGFIIGFTVGFLVNEYVMKGMLFALAAVLPHNFLAIPAIVVTGVASVSFSLRLLRRKARTRPGIVAESINYTGICLVMLLLIVVAAFIEVYVSPVFMKLVAGLLLK
ncbi:stage II sporulation protein M|uniref:Stage II sporulation protein M n=1 Tax=Dendrosporobacter quercicolus TaxID=146817 RepID=A0A1G9L0C7_9FIRM|nr:stage II sporulation protein M [Dendrosporobacter quercicolus]NSL46546.1 stage II sporulation protein M [Dendrosporobacter quercicolus DSM 1736]SDL55266.1 stage II sporulation protein M [Dendrosporobacter quercicolus]